jgi:hypothetical protein
MKRLVIVLALLAAIAGCSSESGFPNPTGKGSIRSINAMVGSPDIVFRIEERILGAVPYHGSSSGQRFDDFNYIFNFELLLVGDLQATRIASFPLKIDADRDFSLVLTGDVAAPVVTVWEADERVWEGTETVFELRFAHTKLSQGDIDIYVAADGVAPALGNEIGTLGYLEILPPVELEATEYVVTATTAGDPTDILYQSNPVTFGPETAYIIPFFGSDENSTANFVAAAINVLGATIPLPDANASPTIRFIQASLDLPDSDVYSDDLLTNQVLSNHRFGEFTDDLPTPIGLTSYFYTPAGESPPGNAIFESEFSAAPGRHYNWLVIGDVAERFALTYIPDRRSISTLAKVTTFHAAMNHPVIDLYVVNAGVLIDDVFPRLPNMNYALPGFPISLAAGSYDVYATVADEKTIVGGPHRLDLVLGDFVEMIFFDTVDPATLEFKVLPNQ